MNYMTDNARLVAFDEWLTVAVHAPAVKRHALPMEEIVAELPADNYRAAWRDEVVAAFDAGAAYPADVLAAFDDALINRLLRTSRALRDDALTRELCAYRAVVPAAATARDVAAADWQR